MDAAGNLAELVALSSEIEQAAIIDETGLVLAATASSDGERLARAAAELLDVAPTASAHIAHVEVDLAGGSVFALRDAGRVAVATTGPEPASALVLHDLRTLLQRTKAEADGA